MLPVITGMVLGCRGTFQKVLLTSIRVDDPEREMNQHESKSAVGNLDRRLAVLITLPMCWLVSPGAS